MGSNFFKEGLDPLGSQLGKIVGSNSSFAKFAYDSPLMNSKFGKIMSPTMYQRGQDYNAALHPAPSAGGSFVGAAPTLADANNSYVNAARTAVPTQKPLPVMGAQPSPQPYVMSLFGRQQGSPYGQ